MKCEVRGVKCEFYKKGIKKVILERSDGIQYWIFPFEDHAH